MTGTQGRLGHSIIQRSTSCLQPFTQNWKKINERFRPAARKPAVNIFIAMERQMQMALCGELHSRILQQYINVTLRKIMMMTTSLSSKALTLKICGIKINVDLYYDSVSNCEEMLLYKWNYERWTTGDNRYEICGNKMTTRCNRGFYCRSYCLLNMFQASLCPSSGAQEYYTVVAACLWYFVPWFSSCWSGVEQFFYSTPNIHIFVMNVTVKV